jgi:acetoacetate decarboxylase
MKKLLPTGLLGLLTAGCSHVGNIDQAKLHTKTHYKLSSGEEIALPLQYKNWKWMMATYSVPVTQIKKLLPEKLEPILISPGKALISFGVLEYPDVTGLAPYDEWLISIPVQYQPSSNMPFLPLIYNPLFPHSVYKKGGSYIHYLPVTTAESHRAGSEIWGFPKVHRQIKCTEDDTQKTCQLLNNGEVEMTLQIEKLQAAYQQKDFTYCSYTEKDETLLRTCVPAKGNYAYSAFGKASINFEQGEIAEQMKQLDINTNKPMQTFMADNLSSLLPQEYERLEK